MAEAVCLLKTSVFGNLSGWNSFQKKVELFRRLRFRMERETTTSA